ncbi:hypothetical protein F5Y13DRAFT_198019 [Hypoxylon sp. FL1857]|nr:hypothetical protein F5Y13DRAFT_198019 [Hypoxylon sp. FL1857]
MAHVTGIGGNGLPVVLLPNQIFNNILLPPAGLNSHANEVVVCVVCGGICKPTVPCALYQEQPGLSWMHPSLIKAKPGFAEWLKERSSRRAYHRKDDELLDLIVVDSFRGGPAGFSNSTNGGMTINTKDAEMHIPIHSACADLAKRFCHYQSRFDIDFRDISNGGGAPSSIMHLYEIWVDRALMSSAYRVKSSLGRTPLGPLQVPIEEPHRYFDIVFTNCLHKYKELMKGIKNPVQEANPSTDYMTTTLIIKSLLIPSEFREMTATPKFVALRDRIAALPEEIKERIEDALEPFDDLGPAQLACTRVYPSTWWKKKLFDGDLIPWLHDIRKPNEPEGFDDGMDWELLCRQLAQPDVCGPSGVLSGHKYLENRQRIWRLLDSARLGYMARNPYPTCYAQH